MDYFHVHLHPLPPDARISHGSVELNGKVFSSWRVERVDRFAMDVTFEQVERVLSRLPRMFFELDGSFVWRGENRATDGQILELWQVDGMVYDVAGRVSRVELKGRCSVDMFTQLVVALQPADKLVAYFVDQGFFLRVEDLIQAWES